MKKIMNTIALSALLASGSLYAGGKLIAPAEVPVAVIPMDDPNPLYIGVGALWAGLKSDCYCPPDVVVEIEDKTWGGIVRFGYDYNQYIGLEGRYLDAPADSDWSETQHYGIYLKPMIPAGDRVNIYGLLGYGKTKIETDCGAGIPEKYDYDGFSYGIGLEYDFSDPDGDKEENMYYDREFDGHGDQNRHWGVWVDYQNLLRDEGPTNFNAYVVTFGITYDF